jgi:hypothetical protein
MSWFAALLVSYSGSLVFQETVKIKAFFLQKINREKGNEKNRAGITAARRGGRIKTLCFQCDRKLFLYLSGRFSHPGPSPPPEIQKTPQYSSKFSEL